jgi:N-acetylglutamate synthase-like GNAT family acetyltransferase
MIGQARIVSEGMSIRGFQPPDLESVLRLHTEGVLMGGSSIDECTGDYVDMQATYFRRPQDHFWVAEAKGQVVGMIGLTEQRPQVAVIRRLRVALAWQDTDLARRLVLTALRHCACHGGLKVIIDAPCDSRRAISFLNELGFQLTRIRKTGGRDLLEFYLNLYQHDESLDLCTSERSMQ